MQKVLHFLIIVLVALLIVTVFAVMVVPRERVSVPHIQAGAGPESPLVATHTFPFEQATVTIVVPVEATVYDGAKRTDKSVTVYGNVSERVWIADTYRAMINDSAQDRFFSGLTEEFLRMQRDEGFTDDETLELMMVYVQSLRYVTSPENPAKYPVETVVEGAGDCDDKSLLLAGLLSRAGYKVALLSFGQEAHMAIGIGTDGADYKQTGYAFIETTNLSFVGVPPDTLQGGVTLRSDPFVIPVGAGTKVYQSGKETVYIHDMYERSDAKAEELMNQIRPLQADLDARQAQIADLESQMEVLRSAGNIAGYNARVSEHNSVVAGYNARLATYRDLTARYDEYAEVHNYILGHRYDRKGVYDYVKTHMPV